MLVYDTMNSPLGELTIISENDKITKLTWEKVKMDAPKKSTPVLKEAKKQLKEYFAKKRTKFDLPLNPQGSDFQLKSWKTLLKIPYGKTWSYQEQALKLGDAKKSRAIGSANGKNPLPILIPCHRVIGKNGSLRGYAGGLKRKQILIDLEK